jgi:hypothetical protein
VVDLIDEIKEDLQQEKYAKLWNKYSNYVLAAIIVVILSTAGAVWWKSHNSAKSEEAGNEVYKAFANEKSGKADAAIELYSTIMQNNKGAAAAVAGLRKANLLMNSGKVDDALVAYKAVADDRNSPEELRDLGSLLYGYNAINNADNADAVARLDKMANGNGAFKYSAKELLAFNNFSTGKIDDAKKLFSELKVDPGTPAKMKERCGQMISEIESKGVEKNG